MNAELLNESKQILGAFYDMPAEEYHAVKAFSYSGSKEFARSPEHYQAFLTKAWERDNERDKFSAVHVLCLEENEKDKIKVVDGRFAGKVKDEVEAMRREGFLVLKPDAMEEAQAIAARIKAHELAGQILSKSKNEVSLFWVDDETGAYCKARIDSLHVDGDSITVTDLKNYGDISNERRLWQQIDNQKYHWQMHHYCQGVRHVFGVEPKLCAWIFVEEKAPHGIKVRVLTEAMEERASLDFRPLVRKYSECEKTNTWPGYSVAAEAADLPTYAWGVE